MGDLPTHVELIIEERDTLLDTVARVEAERDAAKAQIERYLSGEEATPREWKQAKKVNSLVARLTRARELLDWFATFAETAVVGRSATATSQLAMTGKAARAYLAPEPPEGGEGGPATPPPK